MFKENLGHEPGIVDCGIWIVRCLGLVLVLFLAVLVGGSETMVMIHHCRMGHIAFHKMSKMFMM